MTEVAVNPAADGLKEAISTPNAPPPGGSYSQAIKAGGLVFLSGQTPRDLSRKVVDGSFAAHARQTLENLRIVAEAAGTSLASALSVTVYLRDLDNFDEMDAIYREFFPEPRPARTTVHSEIPVSIEINAILAQ